MYCSSCGSVVKQGLSYCNHCGAKLSGAKTDSVIKSSEVKPGFLVFGMIAVFIFGLLAIGVLTGLMKRVLDFNVDQIFAFMLLSFLIMLSVEGMCIWLLLRRKRGAVEAGDTVLLKEQVTKELDAPQARALAEPVSSITEHTTRKFEPLYSERKTD